MTLKITKNTYPKLPGIYLFKNKAGEVIYIGKAKSLANRIKSYFQKRGKDWKVDALLQEHADIDIILTHNEQEALLLEAQLIKEHQPKFNVLLKDGQPFLYIHFTNDKLPKMELVRTMGSKGRYIGPFLQKTQARKTFDYLMRTFKLQLCNKQLENGCLDYHLGLCPGNCMPNWQPSDYLFRLELAYNALKSNHKQFLNDIKSRIAQHNKLMEFEQSKILSDYLTNIDQIFETIKTKFSAEKFATEAFVATTPLPQLPDYEHAAGPALQKLLNMPHMPRTIDCFDISHFQSRSIVGSCVRFTNGKPDKNYFRKFNIKSLIQQNDYAALAEIVGRRYKEPADLPDLIVIDGGKGQLGAARSVLPDSAVCISLAKREETIFGDMLPPEGVILDIKTDVGRLLIALRDYAHHFAITFHRKKRSASVDR